MRDLVIVRNPDPDSRLPYLVRLPLGGDGLTLRAAGTWPREKAIYCYPATAGEWPDEPEVVEQVPVRSCVRRGAAIDLVLNRARENRSQIVFTTARGRDAIFWQTARVRKQARPRVTTPTARASGVTALPITVASGERYGYRFPRQQVEIVKRRLACGDYAVEVAEHRTLEHVRPAVVADGITELQVAFPTVPIVFCESRQLAAEWTDQLRNRKAL